jgi:hypothetical protein
MSERAIGWTTSFWLLICASLAGVIALELSSSLPLAPKVTAAAPAVLPAPEPLAPRFDPPPAGALDEIAERPLFFESRRPFVAPPIDQEPAAAPLVEEKIAVELVGTLVTDQGRAALVQPAGQDASWRREGDKIAGWRIGAIERDSITLRQGDETETLTLRADLAGPAKPNKAETAADRRKRKKQQQQQQAVANDPTHN